MPITQAQHDRLLAPLDKSRIEARKGMSYLNVSDVRRWLIRIFGFGGFSTVADEAEMISCREVAQSGDKTKMNWEVCWKVRVTLTIPSLDVEYAEYAIGSSSQPSLPESHDMAIKTAESDALKRCAVNLGDQFGLSLYFSKGREVVTSSVMRVLTDGDIVIDGDVQAAPEQTGEILDTPTALDPEVEAWLTELRSYALEPDNQKRITAVAGLKITGKAILGESTVVQGQTMTLARVADLVAQGSFLPTDKDV